MISFSCRLLIASELWLFGKKFRQTQEINFHPDEKKFFCTTRTPRQTIFPIYFAICPKAHDINRYFTQLPVTQIYAPESYLIFRMLSSA